MKIWPQRIISFLSGFLVLSSLHCTLVVVVTEQEWQTFLCSLIYLPIVMILSISEKKTEHFWQYMVCAALALGIAYFGSRTEFERSVACVLTILAIISYFYANAKKIDCWLDKPSYLFLGIFLGSYLMEMRYESKLLENYGIFGAGIYYLLCTYQTNLTEIEYLLDMSGELKRFPTNRLLKSNWLMLGLQTVIVTIGMCAAPFFRMDGLISNILEILRKVIAWILSFLEAEEAEVTAQEAEEVMEQTLIVAEAPSPFVEFLLKLLDIFSWAIVIAITGYAIYKILSYLYQLYLDFDARSAENGDQIEQIHIAATKEEKKKLRKQRQENLFWDRTPNARIRKSYKKRVLKELKEAPKAYMTPEELEEGVLMSEEEKHIFHTYYEKARYGKEGCTKEEMMNYRF